MDRIRSNGVQSHPQSLRILPKAGGITQCDVCGTNRQVVVESDTVWQKKKLSFVPGALAVSTMPTAVMGQPEFGVY
jgi:hypothetical protein